MATIIPGGCILPLATEPRMSLRSYILILYDFFLFSVYYIDCGPNVSAALVLAIDYLPPDGALPVIFGILFQQSASAIAGGILFKKRAED